MASSTPPHYYSINPTKTHQIPNTTPQQHHRRSAAARIPSPSPAISSAAATTGSTATTAVAVVASPVTQSSNELLPSCPTYFYSSNCPRLPRPELGPEFRRARTTRVISKRNTHSPKPSHDHHRSASPAAAACLAQLVQVSRVDDRTVAGVVRTFQPSLAVPDDYCYLLHELGDRVKHPGKALAVSSFSMRLMRTSIEKGKILTATIGALGRMGRHDLAKHVFDSGTAEGYGNTVFAYSALISAYARNGLSSEAIKLFEAMKTAGLRPNNVSYNAVIDACVKGGLGLHVTLSLCREMIQYGLRPDRKTFNSLLAGCSRTGRLDDAHAVFHEMVRSGTGRDIYTYNTFVDALCKCGNMELALQVLGDMPANGVSPNVVTYSTLIDGYSKLERFDEALRLYEEMKSLKLRLDRVCCNTLLSIYVRTGRYEEISRIYEEMDALGIDKDTVTYNCLITGFGKQGRFDIVNFLLQDMRERGIIPSVLTYSTLIDIYSKAGMFGEAANVFLEFKESGLKADVVLYSSFIDTLSKNGLVQCAVWLLDEMTAMGIEPNVVTYNTIIDAFGKSRVLVEDNVRNEAEGSECSTGTGSFSQLVKGIGRPMMEEARRRSEELFCVLGLFQRMIQQGIKPNVVTFSAILNACSRCNSFEDASLLLEQLRLFDSSVYGVAHGLLTGCGDVWVQAQSLFDELQHMDQPTSSAFYNALTDMLWHFGQKRGAQRVVLEGVQRKVWEKTWSDFCLDLHLMSTGAAQAMVHAWLLSVRSIVFQRHQLPECISILTGWGRHSKVAGASTLRRVVETLLNSIGAPFQAERFNIGRFVTHGSVISAWLRESGTVNILLLSDERPQSVSTSGIIPRLQAVQL